MLVALDKRADIYHAIAGKLAVNIYDYPRFQSAGSQQQFIDKMRDLVHAKFWWRYTALTAARHTRRTATDRVDEHGEQLASVGVARARPGPADGDHGKLRRPAGELAAARAGRAPLRVTPMATINAAATDRAAGAGYFEITDLVHRRKRPLASRGRSDFAVRGSCSYFSRPSRSIRALLVLGSRLIRPMRPASPAPRPRTSPARPLARGAARPARREPRGGSRGSDRVGLGARVRRQSSSFTRREFGNN